MAIPNCLKRGVPDVYPFLDKARWMVSNKFRTAVRSRMRSILPTTDGCHWGKWRKMEENWVTTWFAKPRGDKFSEALGTAVFCGRGFTDRQDRRKIGDQSELWTTGKRNPSLPGDAARIGSKSSWLMTVTQKLGRATIGASLIAHLLWGSSGKDGEFNSFILCCGLVKRILRVPTQKFQECMYLKDVWTYLQSFLSI